jgi:hypothetical protein
MPEKLRPEPDVGPMEALASRQEEPAAEPVAVSEPALA